MLAVENAAKEHTMISGLTITWACLTLCGKCRAIICDEIVKPTFIGFQLMRKKLSFLE